jgi:hypothetical protein
MLRTLEDFAAIGALALEHTARVMQAVREDMEIRLHPGNKFAIVPDDALETIV